MICNASSKQTNSFVAIGKYWYGRSRVGSLRPLQYYPRPPSAVHISCGGRKCAGRRHPWRVWRLHSVLKFSAGWEQWVPSSAHKYAQNWNSSSSSYWFYHQAGSLCIFRCISCSPGDYQSPSHNPSPYSASRVEGLLCVSIQRDPGEHYWYCEPHCDVYSGRRRRPFPRRKDRTCQNVQREASLPRSY